MTALRETMLLAVAEKIGDKCTVWEGVGARDIEDVLREAADLGLVALAEPVQEQEPAAWQSRILLGGKWGRWQACDPPDDFDEREVLLAGKVAYQIRPLYTAPPQRQAEPVQEPAFHGFMSADGTQVDVCFTPSAPRSDGTYATAYYTAPPEDIALLRQALKALYATERFCGHATFPACDVASAIITIRARLGEIK